MPRMPNRASKHSTTFPFLLLLAMLALIASPVRGQSVESISIGIQSKSKLGKWVPVSIKTSGNFAQPPTSFTFSALDSNAATVSYRGPLTQTGTNEYQAWGKLGRLSGSVSIQLSDTDQNELCTQTFSIASVTDLQAATSNHLLLIGGNEQNEFELKSAMSALMGSEPFSILSATSATELPTNWVAYDGVDTIFLSTSDLPFLNEISELQWDSIRAWVQRGGRLIVSANGKNKLLESDGLLSRFLVGEFREVAELTSVTKLDSYAGNRLDTEALSAAKLEVTDGKIELSEEGIPLVIRQVQGLGHVVFITFDINDPVLEDWKGNGGMFLRFLKSGDDIDTLTGESGSVPVNLHGFRDISGQLKIPLEKFNQVRLINFTVVAVLIGLFILCIGPGDFFFLKKITGKMELTWVTLLLITIGFCGLAFGLSRWSRPNQFQINQLEIIDIDGLSNQVRGNAWSNLYSPNTAKHQISFDSSNSIGFKETDRWISWFGIPGKGVGGMQTKAGLISSPNSYVHQNTSIENQISTELKDLPLQVSSTRMFHTEWAGQFAPKIESKLKFEDSQLVGQIANPFPFELKNVRVMYGNYTYILQNTLAPETPFDVATETRLRTSKSYLTRRGSGRGDPDRKDRSQNLPWDPINSRLERIAEMMMFYEIANGQDYTSLTHRYQNRIEMSEHLACNRAILIGEVDRKTCQITIDGDDSTDHYDEQITVFRILLPVE